MMLKTLENKSVLITGASSGIGFELAKCFVESGASVVAVASDMDRLSRAVFELQKAAKKMPGAECRVTAIDCDLGQPGAAERLVSKLAGAGHSVDVLVNDAGFGDGRDFIDTPHGILSEMINTNVLNLTLLTRFLLPGMIERGEGAILNLASTASFVPGPHLAVYCATKAFVLSLSQALWRELAGTGVTVTALCPGGTDTDFARVANMQDTLLFRFLVMQPADVARIGFEAMMKGRRQVTAGNVNRILTALVRLSPVRLTLNLTELILRHRENGK